MDIRDLSRVQLKNESVLHAFDKKVGEVSSAVSDRPTDSKLEM